MIDKELLSWLEEKDLVDSRFVIWWQKNFEGRKIFSEEEFNQGLVYVEYDALFDVKKIPETMKKRELVWFRDDVPILLRKLSLEGKDIPVFVTVKPMSHDSYEGWKHLENIQKGYFHFPLEVFFKPHIRGVVIDDNSEFLFWVPFGKNPSYYSGAKNTLFFKDEKLPCMFDPIHPTRFYKNLIENGWSKGRRPQAKPETFSCLKEGFEIVPYYSFRSDQKHLMIYPAPIFEGKLDFPIIIKGGGKSPEILGVGYFSFFNNGGIAYYWNLDNQKIRNVKNSLISRLGDFRNPSFDNSLDF